MRRRTASSLSDSWKPAGRLSYVAGLIARTSTPPLAKTLSPWLPDEPRYQQFLDDLVALYRDAKKIANDQRYVDKDFRGLVNELLNLVVAEQLFVFVEDPQVEPSASGIP